VNNGDNLPDAGLSSSIAASKRNCSSASNISDG